jgi:hypothetical protein
MKRYEVVIPADLPTVNVLLRKLYLRAHPDLFRTTHPELATINDQSMQNLNGILTTIKEIATENQYPPQIVKTISFHIKNSQNRDQIDCVDLYINTGGGDCRNQLMTSFERFFVQSEISTDGKFQWGKDYYA